MPPPPPASTKWPRRALQAWRRRVQQAWAWAWLGRRRSRRRSRRPSRPSRLPARSRKIVGCRGRVLMRLGRRVRRRASARGWRAPLRVCAACTGLQGASRGCQPHQHQRLSVSWPTHQTDPRRPGRATPGADVGGPAQTGADQTGAARARVTSASPDEPSELLAAASDSPSDTTATRRFFGTALGPSAFAGASRFFGGPCSHAPRRSSRS